MDQPGERTADGGPSGERRADSRRFGWRAVVAGTAACVAVACLAAGGAFAPVLGEEPAASEAGSVISGPAGGAAIGAAGGTTSGDTNAEAVTTEDGRYCAHLQAKFAQVEQDATQPQLEEAVSLSAEGTRLCEEGNVRGGIRRLRRALVLLMHAHHVAPDGAAAADAARRP